MVMRIVTFKLEEALLEKVDILAKRMARSRSEIIRQAIIEYIERNKALLYLYPIIKSNNELITVIKIY